MAKTIQKENRKVLITDTILRDAHQSQAATRMRIDEMVPVLEQLEQLGVRDEAGFHGLGQSVGVVARSERVERGGVGHNEARLPERAHDVLGVPEVDGHLAADG